MRFAALLIGTGILLAQPNSPLGEEPLRVLFLGNSYTYFNEMPAMVMALANAQPGRRLEVKSTTRGGATLEDLWNLTPALTDLRSGKWDVVVLQDQSTLGQSYVEARWGVNDPAGLLRWTRFWNEEIQRKGAKPLLYLTWARKAHPEFQSGLNYAYSEAAREIGASIAPAGLAWQRIRQTQPQIELFDPDGSHPSPQGSYLTACVFVEILTARTCEGTNGVILRLKMSDETQRWLVQAAHFAVEQWRAGALTNLARPNFGTAKVLTPTAETAIDAFNGKWSGKAMILDGEYAMDLMVEMKGKTCSGSLGLENTAKKIRLAYPLANCAVDSGTLLFATSDPRLLVDEYRAVLEGGKLIGSHNLRESNPYKRILGSFELQKD